MMRRTFLTLIFVAFLATSVSLAHAIPVFDAPNYALNTIRNLLLESQHVRDMLEAAKRLIELKRLTQEFQFFNNELIQKGFSEIRDVLQMIRVITEDPKGAIIRFGDELTGGFFTTLQGNPFFSGSPEEVARIETWVNRAEAGTSLPYYLNLVPDPLSPERQYITYEQAQIARSFDQAESLRKYAKELAQEGEGLAQAASEANLLGANRLQTASMGKLYEILGMILASQGRVHELQAISLEQVSRQEKLDELARKKTLEDVAEFVHGVRPGGTEVL